MSYINEFERLLDDSNSVTDNPEAMVIEAIASINVTEKRGCEYFSAHIQALKKAEQTEENIKIRTTIERIFPEEAGHVRWGNRWLADYARRSETHRSLVEKAKQKYTVIEQAAYEAGMDITAGAELRRVSHLLEIANTLPLWDRPQYLLERLPETLLAPELQTTRLQAARRAWDRDPQLFMEKFVPMFLHGLQRQQATQQSR
jgi:hypothetical protein